MVLCGEAPQQAAFPGSCAVVPGLHYSNAQPRTPSAEQLWQQLRTAARAALGADPDIWHFHNHSLGKNTALPGLIGLMAAAGEALLLQMHDFAEDGRPHNYHLNQSQAGAAEQLYPQTAQVHYAVLNERDRAFFQQTGIAREQLHLLANPVESSQALDPPARAEVQQIRDTLNAGRLFLAPVRAVRRKNFGEILLWAALAREGDVFATTLGPTNQDYLAPYQRWTAFARSHKLPVHFGVAEHYPHWRFEALMQSADAILTTSIAEGFGLAFLEPWLFGKAIVGRNLPPISADFVAHGIDLSALYNAIGIPAEWLDLPNLRSELHAGLQQAYAAYATPLPADSVERALGAIQLPNGQIDFAGLNESQQQAVISRLVQDADARQQISASLSDALAGPATIQDNAAIIRERYSVRAYAQSLKQLYQQIAGQATQPVRALDAQALLRAFLQPESFRLLRG